MTISLFPRLPGSAARRRMPPALLVSTVIAGAMAFGWPLLLALPVAGGPLVALCVGTAAWAIARGTAPLPAPRPHANDNAPLSPARPQHVIPAAQRPWRRVMVVGSSRTEPSRAGGRSVIGGGVTITGDIATASGRHVDGIKGRGSATAWPS